MAVNLISWFYFCLIEVSVKDLDINRAMGLVINRAIWTGTNIAIGFSGLFLW